MRILEAFPDKIHELVLYVCAKSEKDDRFGRTKLNKILFFADFLSFAKTGKAITGVTYWTLPWGPGPKCLLPVLEKLAKSGRLAEQDIDFHGNPQKRPIALKAPDLKHFGAAEISLVDYVIEKLWNLTATEVSEFSHRFLFWWDAMPQKTDIPYAAAWVSVPTEFTSDEIALAENLQRGFKGVA
jgi:hypothetical protein